MSEAEAPRLFRQSALDAQQANWLGEIILVRPLSFTFLTGMAALMALVVICFFLFGSYTKRTTIHGQLVPATGQVKIHVRQTGIVSEKFVQEGQLVERGEPLIALTSERYGEDGAVQAAISRELEQRRDSLRSELEKMRSLQLSERDSLERKVESLKRELAVLEEQTASQRRLVSIASNAAGRYEGLMEKGYISMDQLQQRQAELLGQRQTLQGLERERTSLQQQMVERGNELKGLQSQHANQLAQVERQLSAVMQELAESEANRTQLITAPESGVATAVLAEVGQTVDSSRPLMSIIPVDTPFEAELYAPSRSIGFVKPGDEVRIRYEAYPYQKFGQYHGKVSSISRTSISYNELATMVGGVPGVGQDGEQLYRLRIQLAEQEVLAYGQPRPLQSGMLLEADILQDTRRLYEWVLEPLYSMTGKL